MIVRELGIMKESYTICYGESTFGIVQVNIGYELFYYNKRDSLVKVFARNISDLYDTILKEISEYYKSEYSSRYYYTFGKVWYAIDEYGMFYKVIKIDRHGDETIAITDSKRSALESILIEVAYGINK